MSQVIFNDQAPVQWVSLVSPIAQLFQSVPVPKGAVVVVMLAGAEAGDAVRAAVHAIGAQLMEIAYDAAKADVELVITQQRPVVVVCVPEVFGWVSKVAFLAGCSAIYTCGDNAEGTLLARAARFAA